MDKAARMLEGKTALVTGSTGGLGFAIGKFLAEQGAHVILHGLEPPPAFDPQVKALEAETGCAVRYVGADLGEPDGVGKLVRESIHHFGAIDILVNNAVTRHFAPIEDFPRERWHAALSVNLTAVFEAIQLVLPSMRARGWGRIINMGSVYGRRGTSNRVDYVATKAAIEGLTKAVAIETVCSGITCNIVCPGSVSTPGTEGRVETLMREKKISRDEAVHTFLQGKQPAGRFIAAESVAAAVAFLCGPAGQDITGATLPVDGGWLAG